MYFCTDNVCKMVCNTVLYIPKEGLQCSPEGASNDKKPIQRMENKPKGFCACVVCVFVYLCDWGGGGLCLCRCLCLSISLSGYAV